MSCCFFFHFIESDQLFSVLIHLLIKMSINRICGVLFHVLSDSRAKRCFICWILTKTSQKSWINCRENLQQSYTCLCHCHH